MSPKQAIVIAAHRSGILFLENLLQSFKGYNHYPIVIVISEYKPGDKKLFGDLIAKFADLPLSLETIETNSFEFGGIYAAYHKTDYDEILLLSHSCEIVDTGLFDIVFKKYEGKSIAFGVLTADWPKSIRELDARRRKFLLKNINPKVHQHLMEKGIVEFWQGHIGKYRREALAKFNLKEYLPKDIIEAVTRSEFMFTPAYHREEPDAVVLFPEWHDGIGVHEEKFGRTRLKIKNDYIIKWKTHWMLQLTVSTAMSKKWSSRVYNKLEDKTIRFIHSSKRFIKEKIPFIYETYQKMKPS
jgi:hypothetical protein